MKKKPTKSKSLTARQLKAMHHLLGGLSMQEVSELVGVTRQTVSEWRHNNDLFRSRYEALLELAEDEFQDSLILTSSVMLARLNRITRNGSDETALKSIQWYFEHIAGTERGSGKAHPLLESSNEVIRNFLNHPSQPGHHDDDDVVRPN